MTKDYQSIGWKTLFIFQELKYKFQLFTDDYVDKDFGTGVVKKVHTSSDQMTLEVGKDINLEMPLCMQWRWDHEWTLRLSMKD